MTKRNPPLAAESTLAAPEVRLKRAPAKKTPQRGTTAKQSGLVQLAVMRPICPPSPPKSCTQPATAAANAPTSRVVQAILHSLKELAQIESELRTATAEQKTTN